MDTTILKRVRTFIEENFLFREALSDLSDTDSLLESGVMDSTGILELVAFLESEFPIVMSDAEIVPDNLNSDRLHRRLCRAQARGRHRGVIGEESPCA